MTDSSNPPGISMTKCEKCGDEYNAAIPTPHVCGPSFVLPPPPTTGGEDVVQTVSTGGGCGVNMTTCKKCGDEYNAAIPPEYHQCSPALRAPTAVVTISGPSVKKGGPCGINMATCSKCGGTYNACLPPSHRNCGCGLRALKQPTPTTHNKVGTVGDDKNDLDLDLDLEDLDLKDLDLKLDDDKK